MKFYITISGGLGNQMLSYALWYYLTYHKHLKTEISPISNGLLDHNGLEINRIFKNTKKIAPEKINIKKIRHIYKTINKYTNKAREIIGLKGNFDISYILPIKLIIFPRYHTYTFINEIIEDIKYIFTFPEESDNRNISIMKEMDCCQSVSIHIRRGDYQSKLVWRFLLGDICEEQYYNKAISYIKSKIQNPHYYIFSDDIEWAKTNLKLTNATYIDWNKGENSFRDMQLMAHCKVNIIANSTFSLMAAWLNVHNNSIRIVPSKWTNKKPDITYKKYIPRDWKAIDNSQPFVSIIINENVNQPIKIIQNINKQTVSDYEIVLPQKYDFLRYKYPNHNIKVNEVPVGHHIVKINKDEEWNSKDKYCLQELIIKQSFQQSNYE